MSDADERVKHGRSGLAEQFSNDARERGKLPNTREIERRVNEIARRNERRDSDSRRK